MIRSHEHIEVTDDQREDPHGSYGMSIVDMIPGQQRRSGSFGSYLICYLRKADLLEEVNAQIRSDRKAGSPSPLSDSIGTVLDRDRRCPHYVKYEAGLSPKEHLLEGRLVAAEEDRRRFERALEQGAQRITVVAAVVTTILGFIQLVAAVISMGPDSIGGKWLHGLLSPPQKVDRPVDKSSTK